MDRTETRYISVINTSKNTAFCFFLNKEMSLDYYKKTPWFHPDIAKKDSLCLLDAGRTPWEKYIEQASDKKLKIFLIEKDSIDKYGWEKIFEKNIYNKQYNLTIDDLNNMDWQIEYP